MAVRPDAPGASSWSLHNVASVPPKWLRKYEDFITKNASQVSQIESTLRSLTYIIPGRFRDAEIASESIHSGVQLLSLYHDTLLRGAATTTTSPSKQPPPLAHAPSPHGRYTGFWARKSSAYRRVAYLLQIVQYTELLCEMAAKRRGERTRWRVVVLIEAIKALCRLLLLRITRSRPLVSPPLPERDPIPEPAADDESESADALAELMEEEKGEVDTTTAPNGRAITSADAPALPTRPPPGSAPYTHTKDWHMPRTGMSLPSLPASGDISSYLLARVLTSDDIKPATRLLSRLRGPSALAAEVLHIIAPLAFAVALARQSSRGRDGKRGTSSSWYPWLIGFGLEMAARQLRDQRGLSTTALERDEWGRRGRAMAWWGMRGPAYEMLVKGVVGGVKRRVPSLVSGILEDYEYLWENYYFSTSP